MQTEAVRWAPCHAVLHVALAGGADPRGRGSPPARASAHARCSWARQRANLGASLDATDPHPHRRRRNEGTEPEELLHCMHPIDVH